MGNAFAGVFKECDELQGLSVALYDGFHNKNSPHVIGSALHLI